MVPTHYGSQGGQIAMNPCNTKDSFGQQWDGQLSRPDSGGADGLHVNGKYPSSNCPGNLPHSMVQHKEGMLDSLVITEVCLGLPGAPNSPRLDPSGVTLATVTQATAQSAVTVAAAASASTVQTPTRGLHKSDVAAQ